MTQEEINIQANDDAYHRYALASILADFAERFDRETLESALNEALPQFQLKVIPNA